MNQSLTDYLDWYVVPLWQTPNQVHLKVFRTFSVAEQELENARQDYEKLLMTEVPITGKQLLFGMAQRGVEHCQIVFHNDPAGNS